MVSRLYTMIFVPAVLRCLGLLLVALFVIPAHPAAAQWWRRRGKSAVSYGLRFVDPGTNEPLTAPVSRLRVGERHRVAVALYAVRNGELDTSTQLARSPQGSITVRMASGNAAVLKIEPAESPILEDYKRTVAEFWIVGIAPGEARVTALAVLGAESTASTWFGPVHVVPAPVATPRRIKPPARRTAHVEPPPTDDTGHAEEAEEAEDGVAQAPPASPGPAAPAEPPVMRNATAIAASVEVGVALPAPLRERMAARLPGPVSQPVAPAAPVIITTLEEALRHRPIPDVRAAEHSADGANEPLLVPPAPAEPETGLFAEVLPNENTEPEPVMAPPTPAPLLTTSAPRREQAAPAPFAVDDLPSDVDTLKRANAESADATPKFEPLPCPRFAHLDITNVGGMPLEVRIRVAGAPAVQVERVAPGAVLSIAPERAGTLWVEAEQPGGGREGLRLVAGETAVDRVLTVPAFATVPWLQVRATLAECAAP